MQFKVYFNMFNNDNIYLPIQLFCQTFIACIILSIGMGPQATDSGVPGKYNI